MKYFLSLRGNHRHIGSFIVPYVLGPGENQQEYANLCRSVAQFSYILYHDCNDIETQQY